MENLLMGKSKFVVEYLVRGCSFNEKHHYFDTKEKAISYGNSRCFDDDGFNIVEVDGNGEVYLLWGKNEKKKLPDVKIVFLDSIYATITKK